MKTPKIDHINMIVPDLAQALEWHIRYLGFEIIGQFKQGSFEIVYIKGNGIVYELFENPSLRSPIVDHIAYTSDNIAEDHAYYVSQGVQVSDISYIDFIWKNGADYFFVDGVANQKIEFIQIR